MRFYRVSDRDVLAMPWPRLIGLYRVMQKLEAEEEAKQLFLTHTSKPAEYMRSLEVRIAGSNANGKRAPIGTSVPKAIQSGVGAYEPEPGSIEAERKRQREAHERLKREWEARRAAESG